MVGVVLVSHSAGLAAETAALARGIAGQDAPIAAAGGDDDGGLGTSMDRIEAAVREVDQGDGVVLIPDVGSSVITAGLLEEPGRAVLADVPFVAGAIAAAVGAGGEGPPGGVAGPAEGGWRHRQRRPLALANRLR